MSVGMGIAATLSFVSAFLALTALQINAQESDVYDIGVGIADVTGPCADVELWGYATMKQPAGGIHTRTYSRAFILGQGGQRVVLVTVDIGSMSEILKMKLVERLQLKYGDLYGTSNVVLSATHTHSAPGGFHQYLLYAIPAEGFIQQTFDAALEGIYQSIVRAHESIRKGRITWAQGKLTSSNYNRSPTAYNNNPKEERSKHQYNVDKRMSILKFTDLEDHDIGMINWFAVHPTSMNNSNHLVSGDNKGYAAAAFERQMNGVENPLGRGPFVAAFAQGAHGDTSPNVGGATCIDTGLPCDFETSTCNGKSDKCIARGPGKDMFENTQIIGNRQFKKAVELFESATEQVSGSVDYRHQFVDMSNVVFPLKSGQSVKTCSASLGYSFAAGTTDGPGMAVFKQGTTTTSFIWNMVRNFIKKPSTSLQQCQLPKPILLPTGEMSFPYEWQPKILPVQLVKIGNVYLAAMPAEVTTMSGRRLEEAIKNIVDANSVESESHVLVQSLSNAYSSYVTTFEEFQIQRYEAASTLFGPHTLSAYINLFSNLAESLTTRSPLSETGLSPPNMLNRQITFRLGVILDSSGIGKNFGDVLVDANQQYKAGEIVSVKFRSGHPRNNIKLEDTFMTVERQVDGIWKTVATDANWETKFYWKRTSSILGRSDATCTWTIPEGTSTGTYRIRHFGHSKNLFQKVKPYTGTSRTFTVQ